MDFHSKDCIKMNSNNSCRMNHCKELGQEVIMISCVLMIIALHVMPTSASKLQLSSKVIGRLYLLIGKNSSVNEL